jgi:hypothetical protein
VSQRDQFSTCTPAQVQETLNSLRRKNAGHKPLTNYFFQRLDKASNLRMLECAKNLYFLHDEWDFSRLYCYSFDAAGAEAELQGVKWPPIVVADWISKDGPGSLPGFLKSSGFHLHATYDRIIYKNLRREAPGSRLNFADSSDRDAIHALLFQVFDKYADHIMQLEELDEVISAQQVILSRDAQEVIDGLVVFPINGKNCNFNFLYNRGGALGLTHLLGAFYGILTERDVETGFSWVRRTRPMVLKLHESFGWSRDGFVDYIYLR